MKITSEYALECGEPKLCECCGKDTTQNHIGVTFVEHLRDKPQEELGHLCIRCFAKGIMWAAKAARQAESE